LHRDPSANVLLITLDTTRADYLGVYGKTDIRTPRMDALARDGVRFANSVTSVPLTLPAHASLMTGSIPPDHGVRDNGGFYLGDEATTLAEVLRDHGYHTGAVVGAFVLNHVWGLYQGFDSYDDDFGPEDSTKRTALDEQRDGAEVVESALRFLDSRGGERFFLWLHFYDPHYPYDPPEPFAADYPDDPYAGEVAYTDELVGRVIDALRERGLFDSTLVVLTADHGEGLGEHGEPDHGIYVYDSTIRVPLLMRAPGGLRGVDVESLSRDIDVAPTILDYLDIDPPSSFRGRSLLPLAAGKSEETPRRAYAESYYVRYHYGWKEPVAVRSDKLKYVDLPRPEVYDLSVDPGELRNLADSRHDEAAELSAWLDEARAQDSGGDPPEPGEMDPETMDRLRALGYLGSTAPSDGDDLPDPKDRAEVLDLLIRASRLTGQSLKSGRYDEAIATVEEALAIEPKFMDGYQFLGTLYLKVGRPDRAIAALQELLRVNPESLPARQALSEAYRAKGDAPTALALLDAVLASSPEYAGAYYDSADLLAEMGRTAEAVERLRQFLARHPDAPRAQYEIGRLLLRQGKADEARFEIERALELQPGLRSAHFNLAVIAEQRGDRDLAVAEYESELRLHSDHHEALTNLGILRMQRGETALGVSCFERLVELRPDDGQAHYLLARAWFSSGRADDEVLRLALRAVELQPSLDRARQLAAAIRDRIRASG